MSPATEMRARRIGITCYPLVGGSGILATALGTELARRGHEVHFFSYARPVRLDLSAPRIHFHEVIVGEHSVFRYPDYTLPLAVRMAEVAQQEGLDVLHVHYAVPHATAAFLAAQMVGPGAPKIVTTLHGTDISLLGNDPGYRPAIEHALACSDAITAVSDSLRRQTHATLRVDRAIDVIPNFFTPAAHSKSRETMRAALGLNGEFLLVHMSNLRPVKRIDLLLRIVAASRHRDRIRLLVLAGGDFSPHRALIAELGLGETVIVRENESEIEDYLPAADAGLYTSELESFGLSILETMFHGKTVVAFNIGGIPEVVGDTGLLRPFGDLAGMAAAIDSLVESAALTTSLGIQAQARARDHFSAAQIVPQYEAVYERVMR